MRMIIARVCLLAYVHVRMHVWGDLDGVIRGAHALTGGAWKGSMRHQVKMARSKRCF